MSVQLTDLSNSFEPRASQKDLHQNIKSLPWNIVVDMKPFTLATLAILITLARFIDSVSASDVKHSEMLNAEVIGEEIQIVLPELEDHIRLVAAGCFEEPTGNLPVLWEGKPAGQTIQVSRVSDAGRDHFYDRFVLIDSTGKPLGEGRYANWLDGIKTPGHDISWPTNIKGLQAISNWKDAAELGLAHMTLNMSISQMIRDVHDGPEAAKEFTYTVDGKTYTFDEGRIRRYDRDIKSATDLGINTVAIILCLARGRSNAGNPIVHPSTDVERSPTGVVAVNTTTAEAERRYRAVMGFLGRRYSREDRKFGHLGGYIIGNEVQSHWFWHNLGEQSPDVVVRQYADQIRLSYNALREHQPHPKVFISMDHHWSAYHMRNRKRAMPGREFLDRLASDIRTRGDFPWNIAFHPYPEDLFKPDFWNDREAWYAFDTPKITYNNVEVLLDYLNRDELKYQGRRRRVILSEQGFHASAGAAGERLQAAAYAASYVKLSAIDGIDAYMLHRYVDHRDEGGANFGLRRVGDDRRPAGKRLSYDVFKAAGTDQQEDMFRFALPLIGIESWTELAPRRGPFPENRGD